MKGDRQDIGPATMHAVTVGHSGAEREGSAR
jgi:hypothetical protein